MLVVQVSGGTGAPLLFPRVLFYYVNENMTVALRQTLWDGYLGCIQWQVVLRRDPHQRVQFQIQLCYTLALYS